MALLQRDVAIAFFAVLLSWAFLIVRLSVARYLSYAFAFCILCISCSIGIIGILTSRPKEQRLPHGKPLWKVAAFIEPDLWRREVSWQTRKSAYERKQLWHSANVSSSIDGVLGIIINTFVISWYRGIGRSADFSNQIDFLLRNTLLFIIERLQSHDIVETVVSRIVPIVTCHLQEFSLAEQAVRGKKLNRNITESEELDLAIASKYNGGKLHPAASLSFSDTTIVQQDYLREIVAKAMPLLLPREMNQSRAVSTLTKEVISCAIFDPIVRLLSDPDHWNQLIESYGRTVLNDRKTVRKMRAALDEHTSPVSKASKPRSYPRLLLHDDERKFEKFIRTLRRCNNLSEARRLRNEISSQLKRESTLESQDPVYLRRLETGKRILDQRVATLSTVAAPRSTKTGLQEDYSASFNPPVVNTSLRDVLRNASRLSYFMEYMDRQKLLTVVQFWLVVEGIRDPLEEDYTEGSHALDVAQWTSSDREDIAQISESYLSQPELNVSPEAKNAVVNFLKSGDAATPLQYLRARQSILQTQKSTFEEMQEQYFPGFQRSDLFYKLLTSDDASAKMEDKKNSDDQHNSVEGLFLQPHNTVVSSVEKRNHATFTSFRRDPTSCSNMRDLTAGVSSSESGEPQQPIDTGPPRPLFDETAGPEIVEWSTGQDELYGGDSTQTGDITVQAVEAALNDIIEHHEVKDHRKILSDTRDGDASYLKEFGGKGYSRESRQQNRSAGKGQERPNLASLGLVNTPSRIGVFKDDDLFGEDAKFLEDELEGADDPQGLKDTRDEVHEAEPGDLGLAEAISLLTLEIDRLTAQDSIVNTLTRKAELTNNVAELRILGKSKSSLQRELRRKELQRQQYIVQESDNSLHGRARIHIKSIVVGKEDDGQEFALYVIEVQRTAGEHMPAASWVVARRYSEFHDLNQRLRHAHPAVRQLEFPRRRLVMKLQRDFLEKRKASLENYLQELLLLPAVCRSQELRAFLSQRPIKTGGDISHENDRGDIVTRIYNSVTDGMDEFLGNIPVLDQLSLAGQNLVSAATTQYYSSPAVPNLVTSGSLEISTGRDEQAELDAFEDHALEPFVKPICDLFLEIFELNQTQNWLRGRAAVVVLQQLLGGTIERKVRDIAKSLLSDGSLLKYASTIETYFTTDNDSRMKEPSRNMAEKATSRREASVVLATLIPELAGSVVGRANAQSAARRIFAALNNRRLTTHLVFQLFDELAAVLLLERASTRS